MTIKKSPVGNTLKDFITYGQIGSGGAAEVLKVRSKRLGHEGKYFALKKIKKYLDNGQDCTERIKKEIEIHSDSMLQHPNIVKYYGSFESEFEGEEYWFIILELCERGSLQDYIKRKGCLREEEACKFIKQIIVGVMELHSRGIIHRDLSLKNLLLTNNYEVKIADFGLAKRVFSDNEQKLVGTFNFMAPEVFDGYYDFKTDCWSIGCVLYNLLYGKPPFDCKKKNDIKIRIKKCDFSFPDYASSEAKELLTAILQKDAKKRIVFKDALTYPFFLKYENPSMLLKTICQRSADSGNSSLSNSASLNSQPIQNVYDPNGRGSSNESRYNEHVLNDEYHDPHKRSVHQYDNNVRSKMKTNSSSSHLKRKNTSVSENQLINEKQILPSSHVLRDSGPLRQLNSVIEDRGISQCKTSTKIQDEQECFSLNHKYTLEINSTSRSNYSVHKKDDSYHSFKGNESESKVTQPKNIVPNKSLKGITPLTTVGLQICRKNCPDRNLVFSILMDGQLCAEFLTKNRFVDAVYFISQDGETINIYSKGKNRMKISDEPPKPSVLINKKYKKISFTFEQLPEKYWERYKSAKTFVDILRANSPKVTIHGDYATCVMTAATPNPQYTGKFYDGYRVDEKKDKIIIKDQKFSVVSEHDSHTQFLLDVFAAMKKECKITEEFYITHRRSNFPVIDGRKRNKKNEASRYDFSSSGRITTMKSFDASKLVESTFNHNSSQKSLLNPVHPCEKSMNTTCRKKAEILEIKSCPLVEDKWVEAHYTDGIKMYCSMKGRRHFFQDAITQTYLPEAQHPDLTNRYDQDIVDILQKTVESAKKS